MIKKFLLFDLNLIYTIISLPTKLINLDSYQKKKYLFSQRNLFSSLYLSFLISFLYFFISLIIILLIPNYYLHLILTIVLFVPSILGIIILISFNNRYIIYRKYHSLVNQYEKERIYNEAILKYENVYDDIINFDSKTNLIKHPLILEKSFDTIMQNQMVINDELGILKENVIEILRQDSLTLKKISISLAKNKDVFIEFSGKEEINNKFQAIKDFCSSINDSIKNLNDKYNYLYLEDQEAQRGLEYFNDLRKYYDKLYEDLIKEKDISNEYQNLCNIFQRYYEKFNQKLDISYQEYQAKIHDLGSLIESNLINLRLDKSEVSDLDYLNQDTKDNINDLENIIKKLSKVSKNYYSNLDKCQALFTNFKKNIRNINGDFLNALKKNPNLDDKLIFLIDASLENIKAFNSQIPYFTKIINELEEEYIKELKVKSEVLLLNIENNIKQTFETKTGYKKYYDKVLISNAKLKEYLSKFPLFLAYDLVINEDIYNLIKLNEKYGLSLIDSSQNNICHLLANYSDLNRFDKLINPNDILKENQYYLTPIDVAFLNDKKDNVLYLEKYFIKNVEIKIPSYSLEALAKSENHHDNLSFSTILKSLEEKAQAYKMENMATSNYFSSLANTLDKIRNAYLAYGYKGLENKINFDDLDKKYQEALKNFNLTYQNKIEEIKRIISLDSFYDFGLREYLKELEYQISMLNENYIDTFYSLVRLLSLSSYSPYINEIKDENIVNRLVNSYKNLTNLKNDIYKDILLDNSKKLINIYYGKIRNVMEEVYRNTKDSTLELYIKY